jgi:hypothetical protein
MTGIEMRLLVLGLLSDQGALGTWSAALHAGDVPHDRVLLQRGSLKPLLSEARGGRLPYQGIIVAAGRALTAMSVEELDAFLEMRRGGRLRALTIIDGEFPHSTRTPDEPVEHHRAFLTAAGRQTFPYLRGDVSLDLRRSDYSEPPPDGERTVLLTDESERPLLYLRRAGGMEDMVQTFPATESDLHTKLLHRGQLDWLTRGVRLGVSRHYLGIQIDDALHSNFHWDVERHTTDRSPLAAVRMSPADARRAADWACSHGLRMDLTFNGVGSRLFCEQSGLATDPLLETLAAYDSCFGWINHTYDHGDLDRADLADIEDDIARNLSFAEAAGLAVDPGALVTGVYSGLANLDADPPHGHNLAFITAIRRQGIRYLACDATRAYPSPSGSDPAQVRRLARGTPFRLGATMVIPRWPAGLPFDATTGAQVLDRLRTEGNPVHLERSWEEIRRSAARRLFGTVLRGRPLPFMFHQSNLIAGTGPDGKDEAPLLLQLLDEVLAMHHASFSAGMPLLQPTMAEIGLLLHRSLSWNQALRVGVVRASVCDHTVTVENDTDEIVEVPLTGTAVGRPYAGAASGWYPAPPGVTEVAVWNELSEDQSH